MPSLHVRAVVYTLKGTAPAKNPYCSIALIWLYRLIFHGGLGEEDELGLILDPATATYMETSTLFPRLVAASPCPVSVFLMNDQPSTALEGMMTKYSPVNYTQDYLFYCDIDILILRSLHEAFDHAEPGRLYTHTEGPLSHEAFGADLPADLLNALGDAPGFSAGKFLATGHDVLNALCAKVVECSRGRPTYWAVEQPFFNHALLYMRGIVDSTLFAPLFCDTVEKLEAGQSTFLDLCGETGDGAHHLSGMVEGLIALALVSAPLKLNPVL